MKKSFYKICLAVNNLKPGDIDYNYQSILNIINSNKDQGIILFPLLSLTSYSCSSLFYHDDIFDYAKEKLIELSQYIENNLVIISIPIKIDNKYYIGIAYLSDKKILGIYLKTLLTYEEKRFFNSGKDIISAYLDIDDNKVFVGSDFVLYDEKKQISIGCENQLADIVICPSCQSYIVGEEDKIINKYRYLSLINSNTYLFVSSKNESATEKIYLPRSYVFQNGDLISASIYVNSINTNKMILDIQKNHSFDNQNERENVFYNKISFNLLPLLDSEDVDKNLQILRKEKYKVNPNPFITKYNKETLKIIDTLANGIVNRCHNTNIYDLVLGLSGGLDSTFAFIILNKARELDENIKIHILTLPYKNNTSSSTFEIASSLIKIIKPDDFQNIEINELVDKHLIDIKHNQKDVTYENAQARMRTYILMNYANKVKGMVIGTGDLSEISLGFATFNGDHISMYNPNASLPKTLIKALINNYSELINDNELSLVLNRVTSIDISPELQASVDGNISQKTEDQIGKYEINDFILYYLLRYGFSVKKIYLLISLAFPLLTKEEIKLILKNFYSRFYLQQFKRNCSSDCGIVTIFSLSPNNYPMPSDLSVDTILNIIDSL